MISQTIDKIIKMIIAKKLIIAGIIFLLALVGGIGLLESSKTEDERTEKKSGFFEKIKSHAPQGKIAFVSSGNIHIMNPDGTNEMRLIVGGGNYVWSPDGKKIMYLKRIEDKGYNLFVIDINGSNNREIFNVNSVNFEQPNSRVSSISPVDWSSDGKKILLAVSRRISESGSWTYAGDWTSREEIYIADADGGNLVKLDEGNIIRGPKFSPDNQKIAYNFLDYDYIYIINFDGTDKIELAEADDCSPVWSPDGKKILYDDDGITIINADGTNKIGLDYLDLGENPVWSPDGEKIAFIGRYPYPLYIINSDGTGKSKIIEDVYSPPSWSPDGEKIVFNKGENKEIYIVKVDGSNLTKLGYGFYPQWSPR